MEGVSNYEAAVKGSKEIAGAVVAATFTTIVVFLPIVFVEGLASQIFGQMALTITCALLASLGVAFLTVPMLSNKLLIREKADKGSGRLLTALKNRYRRFISRALRFRVLVIILFFAALAGSIALVPRVGMEFIPAQDTGEYQVVVNLPRGVVLRETLRIAHEIEAILYSMYTMSAAAAAWALAAAAAAAGPPLPAHLCRWASASAALKKYWTRSGSA
jgi:HAE1 family hydrophobic/amphiphilic exporter-1